MSTILFVGGRGRGMTQTQSQDRQRRTAQRACEACQRLKRRCDKLLPSCALCARVGRACEYYDPLAEGRLRQRVAELEVQLAKKENLASPDSRAESADSGGIILDERLSRLRHQKLFIDSDLTRRQEPGFRSDRPLPTRLAFVADSAPRTDIIKRHFQTIHRWAPIVSKVRIENYLGDYTQGMTTLKDDFALLIAVMKLLQEIPQNTIDAVGGLLYNAVKEFSASLTLSGVNSLRKVQADLLIATYELGHGIFPAAYISIGTCITHAIALGIHSERAPQMLEKARNWVEWEERSRVWWMAVILDRCITAGGDDRPLSAPEPTKDTHLPVDDEAWDRGESLPPERITLSSIENISASPFARVAQASHLLGQVISHCNRHETDLHVVREEIDLLQRAVEIFLNLMTGAETDNLMFYDAMALGLWASMKLADEHSCDSYVSQLERSDIESMRVVRAVTARSRDILKASMRKTTLLVKALEEHEVSATSSDDLLPPWCLGAVYRTVVGHSWMASAVPQGEAAGFRRDKTCCVELLKLIDKRWKLSGAYLEAIAIMEEDLANGEY